MEPLDNWVWRALTGPQQQHAQGAPPALRYDPEVAIFGALPDVIDDGAWAALAELVGPGGSTAVIRSHVGAIPDGWDALWRGEGLQMLGPLPGHRPPLPSAGDGAGASDDIVRLGADDVADMLALVALTEPGPFAARTVELGCYLGIRHDGELVAMAGERVRIDGYTELSAVCTHPAHRGQGHAGRLLDRLIDGMHARGDVPFLHVVASNTTAISRYVSLGFETRRPVEVVALAAPA